MKGVRDSLNPLNARNNLRSVPSATIFSGGGWEEGFLSFGRPFLFLPFPLFFHPPRKPTPLSTISSARHPPRCHTGTSPVPYINQRTNRGGDGLVDRLTFDLPAHPFAPRYTPTFWKLRKYHLARPITSRGSHLRKLYNRVCYMAKRRFAISIFY